jgi:tagatose-1,6-bisphosphate aldolase non-catalytic subunit AgaZ/GatZ
VKWEYYNSYPKEQQEQARFRVADRLGVSHGGSKKAGTQSRMSAALDTQNFNYGVISQTVPQLLGG